MNMLPLLLLNVLFLISFAHEENHVIVLDDKNFEQVVSKYEYIVVIFYASRCARSQATMKEFEQVAGIMRARSSHVKLAKIDAMAYALLASEQWTVGYPSIKYYRNSRRTDYQGDLNAKAILDWIDQRTKPMAKNLLSTGQLKEFKASSDLVVIGVFKDKDSNGAREFLATAGHFDDIPFGITSKEPVKKELKLNNEGIVLLREKEGGRVVFDGKITTENVKTWVQNRRHPLIAEFTVELGREIFNTDLDNHCFLCASRSNDRFDEIWREFKSAAKIFIHKVHFIFVDIDKEDNKEVLDVLLVNKHEAPALRFTRKLEQLHIHKPDFKSMSTGNIVKWAQSCTDGKAPTYWRSEPEPENSNQSVVKKLVGSTFSKVALDSTKNVLVEFVASWCEECKNLSVLETLATNYKDRSDVIVAVIDTSLNEVEGQSVEYYPSYKFYPANSYKEYDYVGEHSVEGLKSFVESGGKEGMWIDPNLTKDEL